VAKCPDAGCMGCVDPRVRRIDGHSRSEAGASSAFSLTQRERACRGTAPMDRHGNRPYGIAGKHQDRDFTWTVPEWST